MKLNSLTNLFKRREDKFLGIDIGSSSIKVVQISRKGSQAVLDTYGELSLGPYSNTPVGRSVRLSTEQVSKALNALISEKEVGITAKVAGIAVPFESSLMKTFKIPATLVKDVDSIVPIEARKYIPVPISEVSLDWSIVPSYERELGHGAENKDNSGKGNEIEVLLVAIHNDIIKAYQEIAKSTPLNVRFFEIEIFSTLRAIVPDEVTPVMVIDMGATNTKVYVLERGIVRSSHTINYGSQDITQSVATGLGISFDEAEVVKREVGLGKTENGTDVATLASVTLNRIFSQASRVIFNFSREQNISIKKVMLVGGGSSLKGIAEHATNVLKTETLMANHFSKLETPAFIDEVLAKTGPEFVVAVGLALRALREDV